MIPINDLGDALEAFISEHERCGELDSAVEDDRVWRTCTRVAKNKRLLEPAHRP